MPSILDSHAVQSETKVADRATVASSSEPGAPRPGLRRARPALPETCDALITQGWGRIAYNIVRSLARRGLKVALGTDEFMGMAVLSRYTSATFRHPPFAQRSAEFIASLRAVFETYSPKVYIPSDQEVMVVARFCDQLSGLGTAIPISPFSTLRQLHKKDLCLRLASSLGLPVPETIAPRNLTEIREFTAEFGLPLVLKRPSSSSGHGVTFIDEAGLFSANGAEDFHGWRYGEFLIQQCVGGTGFGVSVLFNHGKLRARFTHKRLREQAPTGGVSTLRVSVRNSLLEEYAERLLQSVDFHGVAMVEFRYDERLKKAWFLEVNPRFWGSLPLAISSGVDFPHLLYRMALEGDVAPVLDYRLNVLGRWILGDAVALVRRIGSRRAVESPTVGPITARVYDDLDWSDPLAFLGGFVFSAIKYWKTRNRDPNEADVSVDRL